MIRYRNPATGRVVTRTMPDPWLDASKRWERLELPRIPLPERAPEPDEDGGEPSEEKE